MNISSVMISPFLRWSGICLLILSLSACDRGGEREAKTDDKEKAPLIIPVEAVSPDRGDIASYFETSTRVEAERKVDVVSKSTARCIALLADEGDKVSVGDIIAELEKNEAEAIYAQSEIQVRQNKTTYDLAKKQYDEGLGSKMDMDNAGYTHEQSLATLETQKIQLENLTIRAPIDGIITARGIQEGMLVSSGFTAFSIMDPGSFILSISPPEKELPRLSIGQKAKVRIDAIPGKQFNASIRRINPSVDPVTGTVKVILDFEKASQNLLRESAFARVKLVMDTRKNVLLIPKEAIVEDNGRKYLYILEEQEGDEGVSEPHLVDIAEETPTRGSLLTPEAEASEDNSAVPVVEPSLVAKRVEIFTGLEDSDRIQVFRGLQDSDLLVINGQHSLRDGTLVRVTNIQNELDAFSDLTADEALEAAEKKREEGQAPAERSGGRGFH